jgi:hypothetical protein
VLAAKAYASGSSGIVLTSSVVVPGTESATLALTSVAGSSVVVGRIG